MNHRSLICLWAAAFLSCAFALSGATAADTPGNMDAPVSNASPAPASDAVAPEPTPAAPPVSVPVTPNQTPGAPANPPVPAGVLEVRPPKPTPRTSIEIDLRKQHAYLLRDGQKIADSPISSGRPGHLTPTGHFEVLEKDANHFSSLYGSIVSASGRTVKSGADAETPVPKGCRFQRAPMKYFLRFDGAAGTHAGVLPGYAASHGCVRMPLSKAKLFYDEVELGSPVYVFGSIPDRGGPARSSRREAALAPSVRPPAPLPVAPVQQQPPKRSWFPFWRH